MFLDSGVGMGWGWAGEEKSCGSGRKAGQWFGFAGQVMGQGRARSALNPQLQATALDLSSL